MSCGVVTDAARILCCYGCGVGSSNISDETPSLGTSMCRGCGPKRTKDLKKKKKKKANLKQHIQLNLFSLSSEPWIFCFPSHVGATIYAGSLKISHGHICTINKHGQFSWNHPISDFFKYLLPYLLSYIYFLIFSQMLNSYGVPDTVPSA